jgi:hypothetical protein
MKRLTWFSALVGASVACGATTDTPEPPPDPTGFTFQTADGTLTSIGWTGVFHNFKGDPSVSFGARVTGCDNGSCEFEGPIDPVDIVKRRRCLYNTSTLCTADNDCLLGPSNQPTPCVYIYDTPIAIPLRSGDGKPGACAFTYIPVLGVDHQPAIQGTLNLVSGELNIPKLTVLLALNPKDLLTFHGVCPVCMGDTSPNDGKKDGTCQASAIPDSTTGHIDPGAKSNTKCDVNRYGDYGEMPGYNFGYSMDCSPTLTPGVGQPTPFGGSFSSSGYKVSITDDSPKCTDANFKEANCFCGMCQDSSNKFCTKSSDCGDNVPCIGASMPTAQADPTNVATAGNLCPDGVCNWNEAEGAGTCAQNSKINCYPSAKMAHKDGLGNDVSISVPGRAAVDHGVYYADTASALCTPAGMNIVVNKQAGLPGLTFQKRNFRIIPTYPEIKK